MADRVRITNGSQHDVGLISQSGIEYNIRPGTFITLTREDAEYMVAIAPKLFATKEHAGELRMDDEETAKDLNLVAPGEPSPADDVVVRKALNGNMGSFRKYVAELKDQYLIDTVCQTAKAMDLPMSKMKVLQEAFPTKFIND